MSRALSVALALALACLAACSSSSSAKGTQVPSEMLGPTGGEPATAAPAASAPTTAPAQSEPATAGTGMTSTSGSTTGSTTGSPSGDPAAPLPADEQAMLAELTTLMKEVTGQFERTVTSLEQAGGDCKKAVTAMTKAEKESVAIEQKMTAFKQKLGAGPKPSAALMSQLRQATLDAFPPDVRARAEVTVDGLDKKCANDADFQRAKAAAAARQQGG